MHAKPVVRKWPQVTTSFGTLRYALSTRGVPMALLADRRTSDGSTPVRTGPPVAVMHPTLRE